MRSRLSVYILLVFKTLWLSLSAQAHEVRPAFLQITETGPAQHDVLWKQPIINGQRLKLTPIFPDGCDQTAPVASLANSTVSEGFQLSCSLKTGIIRIEGLERTLTDVFVEIQSQSGDVKRALLKPDATSFNLGDDSQHPTRDYLWLGVEHIIFGWDHLLFVIGLSLLVTRRQIWGVATAFTLAHSLTLGLAAFGLLNVPTRPVEILIAASIVLLGVEVMRKINGQDSLATRRPYLISFGIGLIHGCGFASALADIGLPRGAELLALLIFNIGIELGQFAMIALTIVTFGLIGKQSLKLERYATLAATYLIATTAMFWVIDRVKDYVI